MSQPIRDLTGLLDQWKDGDRSVENQLVAEVYPIMCAQAQAHISRLGQQDLTWCATELAHEAFERLSLQRRVEWRNREHFFAISATVIRRVLVDYLRQRSAEKRGSEFSHVPLEDLMTCQLPETDDVVNLFALDQLLNELGRSDMELLRIVELRVFSGLNVDEIAQVCGISTATVGRRWRVARAWLSQQINPAPDDNV